MILIFTKKSAESSAIEVAHWIDSLQGNYLMIAGEHFDDGYEVTYQLSEKGRKAYVVAKENKIDFDDVHVVWYRRDSAPKKEGLKGVKQRKMRDKLESYIKKEQREAKWVLFRTLRNKRYLTMPFDREINKLEDLELAAEAGLMIPPTLLCNTRHELVHFYEKHGELISKPIWGCEFFHTRKTVYGLYTETVGKHEIAALPEKFQLALFQQKIEKDYELRVFFLNGTCYSMAIFSQADEQTSVDFRRYNFEEPNRTVPYQLPSNVEQSIVQLMDKMQLKTGSIDIVRSRQGAYYYLECNPVGQFGMVSKPCNYYLEREIASFLTQNDTPYEKTTGQIFRKPCQGI